MIITNPYLFADWGTFTHDLNRQRKFASGDPLLGQPERNGWVYYVRSSAWALGIIPGLLAVAGGIALLVKGRRREAIVLGSLIILYWLYMGSQSRFYARWMLPLYPALAILAGYACTLIRQRIVFGALVALALAAPLFTTVRNAIVLGREDTRTQTRDWLVAHVPQGTKVAFEPIAPSEWYGVTPGGGAKADPRQQWARYNRSQADIKELAQSYRGALRTANFQNYERTLDPEADRHLPPRGRVLDRHGLDAVRPRRGRAAPRARGPEVLPPAQARGRRALPDDARGPGPALPGRQVVQLRRRRVLAARAGDDRLPIAQLRLSDRVSRGLLPFDPWIRGGATVDAGYAPPARAQEYWWSLWSRPRTIRRRGRAASRRGERSTGPQLVRTLLACLAFVLLAPAAEARVVLVATGGSSLALIDTGSNLATASPPLPGATRGVAAAPDGSRAYVAAGRGIAVIDLATRKVTGGVPLQSVPAAIAVSPDGQRLYAARRGGLEVIDPLGIKALGVRVACRVRRSISS